VGDDVQELEARVRALREAGELAAAATAAIRGLGPSVLRYLRSLLRDEDDAAEAFSRFAENLWTGLPGFRGQASVRTWAYRLAWSAAQDLRDGAWKRRGAASGPARRRPSPTRCAPAPR
jgi:RNA polymerase sigma-70 factor (ECF subfamily)